MSSLIEYERAEKLAARNRQEYETASPFPHIVIDDLFNDAALEKVLTDFPEPEKTEAWRNIHTQRFGKDMQVHKLGLTAEHEFPASIRQLIWELNASPFLKLLEKLTGIKNLLPDPLLRGGGLHQVLPGGLLGVHADFTKHRIYKFDRRINLLLFLNKDWEDDFGGHLELWSRDVSHCEKMIRPLFGRCVIFNTDQDSYHGHPHPLTCPPDRTRKSIALYYYTNGREDREVEATHATDWQDLPETIKPALV